MLLLYREILPSNILQRNRNFVNNSVGLMEGGVVISKTKLNGRNYVLYCYNWTNFFEEDFFLEFLRREED